MLQEMKTKPHFNSTFGRWKTAPYGRNPNERTQMEKVSEMWKAFHRRVSALLGLRCKANKNKKAKSQKKK